MLIKRTKKPIPKFFGNGISLSSKVLNAIPPIKLPILLKANPSPKNRPRSVMSVVLFKNSAQTGTTTPIDKLYNKK